MKKSINMYDYIYYIQQVLPKGILLTSSYNEKVNSMTISWGMIGQIWNKPVFIAFVREGRFTKYYLEENPCFTINLPYGEQHLPILTGCGSLSGKEFDKVDLYKLHPMAANKINGYALKEFPLTLECKIIYKQLQDIHVLPEDIREQFYSKAGDLYNDHIAYYAEIVDTYVIEEEPND